ncbi:MAG: GAF domain-containing protein [Desulfatitalea sp.]|nr:GAF domain-containing protein [Desulfatitalea sp.]
MQQEPQRKFYLPEFRAISRAISTYEDLNLLIDHFVEGVTRAFKVKGASIMLYDEVEDQLFRVGSYGISERYLRKGPVFLQDQDDAFAKGAPVFVQDLENDPRVQYPEAARSENIRSMLSFPIKCREDVVGIVRIYHSEAIAVHPDDLDSIQVLALHLGLVIDANGLRNFVQMVSGAIDSLPARMRKGS